MAITGWRVGVVVDDLERATAVYRALGASMGGEDDVAGTRRRRLRLGANTTIELVKPIAEDTVAARDLAANGEIIHSCIFESSDLASAESHLTDCGVVIAQRAAGRLIADPQSCHGAVIEIAASA